MHYPAQLETHQPTQAQSSALRLVYTPLIIRKAVPAPATVQRTLTSIAAVQAYRANRAISWYPLQIDDTIPRNEAECFLYVVTFLSSLTEVRECVDEERRPFPKHWTDLAEQARLYFQEDDMSNAAWDLLDIMIALHLFDPSALKTRKPADIAESQQDEGMSFQERAGKICNGLRLSKHRSAMIVAGDSVEAFLALVSKKERVPQITSCARRTRRLSGPGSRPPKMLWQMRPQILRTVATTAAAVAAALTSGASDSNSGAPADVGKAAIPDSAPTIATGPERPSSTTKSKPRSKTRQCASKSGTHNGQNGGGRQGLDTDGSRKAQNPVHAKVTSTSEGAIAGSNVHHSVQTFGNSQPSDDSDSVKKSSNASGLPIPHLAPAKISRPNLRHGALTKQNCRGQPRTPISRARSTTSIKSALSTTISRLFAVMTTWRGSLPTMLLIL